MDKQFQEVSKMIRTEARAKRPKNNQVSKIEFLRASNPRLSKIYRIIRKHLSPLHCDGSLKDIINPFNCLLKNANFSIKTSIE